MKARQHFFNPEKEKTAVLQEIGGKALQLFGLQQVSGIRVPAWFVIKTSVFTQVLQLLKNQSFSHAEDFIREARKLDFLSQFGKQLASELEKAGLSDQLLAVRSSATVEDGRQVSFAGQFTSVLGVRGVDSLCEAVLQVWASVFSENVLAYNKGNETPAMAVVIQKMVDSECAGVCFSVDPVMQRFDVVVLSAVPGLGEALVSGETDADSWRILSDGTVLQKTMHREKALYLNPDGNTQWLKPVKTGPVLNKTQVLEIAKKVRLLESRCGSPQDMEWAVDRVDGSIQVLQTRPVTTFCVTGDVSIWDNSNIAESYPGVVRTLTFSFASDVYDSVYRQFVQLMGVPDTVVEKHRGVFANMLGQVQGRMYYNLLNWYRVLSMLPGFSLNRSFMEKNDGGESNSGESPATG